MTELQTYIKSYFGIRPEDLEKIAALFKEELLEKGSFYAKQGRNCQKLSFVKSGFLRVYAEAGDREVTQWISFKGYFLADLSSLVFETPARWNICALTDCELFTVSREDYRKIGKLIPDWYNLEKLFIAKCFLTLEDRVFSHLSMTAEERYRQTFEFNPELFNRVPLHYLASMMGMTPETLSRIRKKSIS